MPSFESQYLSKAGFLEQRDKTCFKVNYSKNKNATFERYYVSKADF